jgi:hypothetical protein
MNPDKHWEDRLERLGAQLRERPPLTDRVMTQLRQSLAEGLVASPAKTVSPRPAHRRWPFVTAVAAIAALVAIALIAFPRHSVGWDEINQAVRAQNWIRASVTYVDGQRGTIWMSPQRGIWAYKNDDRIEFTDGLRKITYDYTTKAGRIIKRRPSDEDRQRVASVDFAREDVLLSGWLFGERVIEQHRRDVVEGGRNWIEFELVFFRGNRGILRVDPRTRLPVSLVFTDPKSAKPVTWTWAFDYPTNGPGDIYAMGAPATAKIDDQTPSDEGARVLDGMAASRSRIGDFRLDAITSYLIGKKARTTAWAGIYRLWRKGNRWRVDYYSAHRGSLPEPPDDAKLGGWIEAQLPHCDHHPDFVCDGTNVYEPNRAPHGPIKETGGWHKSSHLAPGDLLSASGSSWGGGFGAVKFVEKVFPDRFGIAGFHYEFDPDPADAPGCVVWKLSARLATAEPLVGHEWYYIDPQKGDAVIRAELFSLPPDATVSPEATPMRSTSVMDGYRQAPTGFWYPTRVRETMSTLDPNAPQKAPEKPHRMTQTIRYHFDFDTKLSDSLFKVDEVQQPKQESGK